MNAALNFNSGLLRQVSLLALLEPEPPTPLYFYQTDTVEAWQEKRAKYMSGLVVMATGLGKSKTFAEIIRREPGRVLCLVHRNELVEQGIETIAEATGEPVSREQADWHGSRGARIVFASVQTLSRKSRLESWDRDHFDLIIVDEGHHAVAPSYKRIFDWFHKAKRLGFTATADRSDGLALGQVFETAVLGEDLDMLWGIENGFLAPIKDGFGERIFLSELQLADLKAKNDFREHEVDDRVALVMSTIMRKVEELAPFEKTILFAPGVKSAELAHLAAEKLGRRSIFLFDGTPKDEREALVKAFRGISADFLANCRIATEGFDSQGVQCIVMAAPTKSRPLYAQKIGRGGRIIHSCIAGLTGRHQATERRQAVANSTKPHFRILDFVGNSGRHSLIGPEDVLAGKYADEEIRIAKKKVAKGTEVTVALREARIELRERARRALAQVPAKIEAEVKPFDPFHGLGLRIGESQRKFNGYGSAATPGMLNALRSWGLEDNEVEGLNKRSAGRLLTALKHRKKNGLATVGQMRQLSKFGIADPGISLVAAQRAMAYLYECRNKPQMDRLVALLRSTP